MSELLEINDTLERLNGDLLDLMIRGLRVCGPEHLNALKSIQQHLAEVGAKYLADRLMKLVAAIESDSPSAASELMETQAAMRVFERVLTLKFAETAMSEFEQITADASEDDK
jgi:hypothetical protein